MDAPNQILNPTCTKTHLPEGTMRYCLVRKQILEDTKENQNSPYPVLLIKKEFMQTKEFSQMLG